jgi:eukaryotic-like serine/threonine-protein kinase
MGTPRYMAPEQAAGRPDLIGPATDVYSLGTILYECLTGQVPFTAAGVMATMEKIRTEEPKAPRRLQAVIPRDLDMICMKCLHKQPTRRYAGADALAEDLGRFLQGEPIHARPTPAWERAWMWSRRRPAAATLTATSLLAIILSLAGYSVWRNGEAQRVSKLRDDLAGLVREGQEALVDHDNATAQERFLSALTMVRGEPALYDQELGVAGWLDHSRRQAEQERWRQRRPPPLFEELRDEALVQCILLDPSREGSTASARQTIQAALGLTVVDDPAWRLEREQLTILDADLVLRDGNAADALAILDQAGGVESRLWHNRRADCLDRLGRIAEADQARNQAARLSPRDTLGLFLSGVDRLSRKDPVGAVGDFDRLLALEPDHFMARLSQAVGFLRQKRLGEAKVALTACLGQRPHFAWTLLFRGQAHLQGNDPLAALEDFRRGLEMNPRDAARWALLVSRGFVYLGRKEWAAARADFDQALALQPDAAEARIGRALALLAQGGYNQALAAIWADASLPHSNNIPDFEKLVNPVQGGSSKSNELPGGRP